MGRVAIRVLLAAMIVLAGCSVGGTHGTGGPTVTPAAVPASPPAGLSDTGVVNASALVAGHIASLSNTTATRVTNRTVKYPNGSVVVENRTTWSGPDARHVVVRTRRPGEEYGYARWQNATHVAGWVERDGRRQYYTLSASSAPSPGVDPMSEHLLAALSAQQGATVDAVECGTDRCLRVSFALDERLVWGDGYPATGPVRYRLTVTADGLVRAMVLTWTAERGDAVVTVRERVAFREVGATSVAPPEWVAERT